MADRDGITVGQLYRSVAPMQGRYVEYHVTALPVDQPNLVEVVDVKFGTLRLILARRLHTNPRGPRGGRHRDGYVLVNENGDES